MSDSGFGSSVCEDTHAASQRLTQPEGSEERERGRNDENGGKKTGRRHNSLCAPFSNLFPRENVLLIKLSGSWMVRPFRLRTKLILLQESKSWLPSFLHSGVIPPQLKGINASFYCRVSRKSILALELGQ